MISSRRTFLTGLAATLVTAPAIVRASSLMPVKGIVMEVARVTFTTPYGTYVLDPPMSASELLLHDAIQRGLDERTFRILLQSTGRCL